MVSANTLLKKIVNVNHCVIDSASFDYEDDTTLILNIYLHPFKSYADRCPHCSKRCPFYDTLREERTCRALDLGGVKVYLHSFVKRICCKEHGVVKAAVPWAYHHSKFTKDFDITAAYLAMNINRSTAAKYLRCDWGTIMRCISRTREVLEPDMDRRIDGLVNIGIDETSYRKGHSYMTVVVNHDTNTVVWCDLGHSKETLSRFFEKLNPKQRDSIKTVTGDGARWIYARINQYIPHVTRCIDGFHVVSWATDAMDTIRKELYQEQNRESKALLKDIDKKDKSPFTSKMYAKADKIKDDAKKIKGSTYTFGKAPEHLTKSQQLQLEYISNTHVKLYRAYKLKELLRLTFKFTNVEKAKLNLKSFFFKATHSRIPVFKDLAYKIRRHEENILHTIETQISNARVESINNKIKLLIRKSYGFRNIQNMINMIMLGCSKIIIPLPNRGGCGLKVA